MSSSGQLSVASRSVNKGGYWMRPTHQCVAHAQEVAHCLQGGPVTFTIAKLIILKNEFHLPAVWNFIYSDVFCTPNRDMLRSTSQNNHRIRYSLFDTDTYTFTHIELSTYGVRLHWRECGNPIVTRLSGHDLVQWFSYFETGFGLGSSVHIVSVIIFGIEIHLALFVVHLFADRFLWITLIH